MSEYTESTTHYLRGQIERFIIGVARQTVGSKEFDRDRWESLGGTRVVHDSFPAYPSEEAKRDRRDVKVLCDWDDETETKYLKQDVDVPGDRHGTIVFENGTVVTTQAGSPIMFALDERDATIIEKWDTLHLEILRDVYGYQPQE